MATGRCHLENTVSIYRSESAACSNDPYGHLSDEEGLPVEVFLEHFTGIKPKDSPGWAGDYSSSSQDVPRAGRSAEGKGHLNQFIFELTGISCGKSMAQAMPFSICLILVYTFSDLWQFTHGNIPRVKLYSCINFLMHYLIILFVNY